MTFCAEVRIAGAYSAQRDRLVGVDADRPLAGREHRLDGAVARGAGDRVDDVDALVEERLGQLLALGGVTPGVVAADEGAGLLGRVPAEELDVRALLLVVDT